MLAGLQGNRPHHCSLGRDRGQGTSFLTPGRAPRSCGQPPGRLLAPAGSLRARRPSPLVLEPLGQRRAVVQATEPEPAPSRLLLGRGKGRDTCQAHVKGSDLSSSSSDCLVPPPRPGEVSLSPRTPSLRPGWHTSSSGTQGPLSAGGMAAASVSPSVTWAAREENRHTSPPGRVTEPCRSRGQESGTMAPGDCDVTSPGPRSGPLGREGRDAPGRPGWGELGTRPRRGAQLSQPASLKSPPSLLKLSFCS